jgi:beta-glucosidase/6-phospho-beta-glucosidase/beta-galactosidase
VKRTPSDLRDTLDWYGLNYYTRWRVRSLAPVPHVVRPGTPVNDLGWEVWPAGLEQALIAAGSYGRPILITENGVADAHDRIRPQALVGFIEAMHRALAQGVPVLGYLHWSLLDNFEWSEGYHGRFGLYGVDFDDPARARTRRPSAEIYAHIARANALGDDARARLLAAQVAARTSPR